MNRRLFLQGLLGATAYTALKTPLLAKVESGEIDLLVTNDFKIDFATKTIISNKAFTIGELYGFLKDQYRIQMADLVMSKDENMEEYEFVNGWTLENDIYEGAKVNSFDGLHIYERPRTK